MPTGFDDPITEFLKKDRERAAGTAGDPAQAAMDDRYREGSVMGRSASLLGIPAAAIAAAGYEGVAKPALVAAQKAVPALTPMLPELAQYNPDVSSEPADFLLGMLPGPGGGVAGAGNPANAEALTRIKAVVSGAKDQSFGDIERLLRKAGVLD